jgi:DNA repair photolyase
LSAPPFTSPVIGEVQCKSALGESRLPGYDYCLNPYVGCSHACIYCYARSYALRRGRTEAWGSYVDVKPNIADVLAKEARKGLKRGVVGVSTLTDAYQPIESSKRLTQRCLGILLENGFQVAIQTKSDLVVRDIEALMAHGEGVSVGFTVTTLDRDLARRIEPGAPAPDRRVDALSRMASAGLVTWIFIGPIFPHITDDGIGEVLDVAKSLKVGDVLFDRLNMRPGVWPSIASFLKSDYPELLPKYKEIFFGDDGFYSALKGRLGDEAVKRGVKFSFCY